jgi:hypothetical protein
MINRVRKVFATRTVVGLVMLFAAAEPVVAQSSPAKATSNQRMIEREAKGILCFAHPTVTITGATYDKTTSFWDGSYALTYKFTWTNLFGAACFRDWHFYFDKEGTITQIGDGATNTTFEPFAVLDAALDLTKDNVREKMSTGKVKENDPVAKLILEAPDMRNVTVQLLRMSQK